jgi:uncharacterized membrane protein
MKATAILTGSLLCFIACAIILSLSIKAWEVIVGILLLGLEFFLAFWAGEIEGKRRAKLEEMDKRLEDFKKRK